MVTTDPGYTDFVLARQGRLRRAAYLMCGDASLAEDLLQEALIALASRWESVEHPDAFVRRVIYRQRVSAWRRQRHEVAPIELDRAAGDGLEAGDHPQDGRLAATGWPEQRDEGTLGDVEVDRLDGNRGAKRLAEATGPEKNRPLRLSGRLPPFNHSQLAFTSFHTFSQSA